GAVSRDRVASPGGIAHAPLTREELLRRAAELVLVLKERAARTEQLRQIPSDTVHDLLASGLIRIGNHRRFGGHDVEVDTAFDVGFELGRGCGSTAWCYSLWTAHNWWLGHFPEKCQDEFFATGPDTLFSSGLNPAGGRVEPVAGGFRVAGRWGFSSGCDAATWALVAIAQGAIDEFTSRLLRTSGPGRTADSVALQLRLAEAAAEMDAARALHRADIAEMLDRASRGDTFTDLDRARYRRDKAFVARLSVRAVDRLFEGGGARAILDSDPIQRCHRDVHGASHHAALSWDFVAEQFGRQALGLPPTA